MNTIIDLSGIWEFKLDEDKLGLQEPVIFDDTIQLPGSTSLAKKGKPNRARETYFLTEVHKFEGYAWYRKEVKLPLKKSELKVDVFKKHINNKDMLKNNIFFIIYNINYIFS